MELFLNVITNVDTYICINSYFYKYIYVYLSPMSISERLNQFDLKIHKVDQRVSYYR
jgi:hypothetical protein